MRHDIVRQSKEGVGHKGGFSIHPTHEMRGVKDNGLNLIMPGHLVFIIGNQLQASLNYACPMIEMAGGLGRSCSSRDPTYQHMRNITHALRI